jgi:uncharacterized protein YndB with AHSA1/START domain
MQLRRIVMCALALLAAGPAAAEVVKATDTGFTVARKLRIAAPPARVWAALVDPAAWWDSAHSFSGSAANLSVDPRAGGCWCEKLADGGSVEHMRVLYAQPGKAIRFAGALGPLQAMPITGVLTVTLASKDDRATEASLTYAIAGAGGGLQALAVPVDGVLAQQWARLEMAAER